MRLTARPLVKQTSIAILELLVDPFVSGEERMDWVVYTLSLGFRDENNVVLRGLKLKEKEVLLARRPGGCAPRTPCLCFPLLTSTCLKLVLNRRAQRAERE